MTETEKKALALVNEVLAENGMNNTPHSRLPTAVSSLVLLRAIEQHEAFRQEVSDAVELRFVRRKHEYGCLERFIIAKPDPLVDAVDELWTQDRDKAKYMADQLHKYLAARGGRIVWEGE